MHDDIHVAEGRLQRLGVADVALPVFHLRPAPLGRVERTAGDPDDLRDPVVVLQEWDEAGAEGAGRPGDGHRQVALGGRAVLVLFLVEAARPLPERPRAPSPGGAHRDAAAVGFFALESFLAMSISSSMPFRIPPDSTSTSGKASKSALMPNVIVFR